MRKLVDFFDDSPTSSEDAAWLEEFFRTEMRGEEAPQKAGERKVHACFSGDRPMSTFGAWMERFIAAEWCTDEAPWEAVEQGVRTCYHRLGQAAPKAFIRVRSPMAAALVGVMACRQTPPAEVERRLAGLPQGVAADVERGLREARAVLGRSSGRCQTIWSKVGPGAERSLVVDGAWMKRFLNSFPFVAPPELTYREPLRQMDAFRREVRSALTGPSVYFRHAIRKNPRILDRWPLASWARNYDALRQNPNHRNDWLPILWARQHHPEAFPCTVANGLDALEARRHVSWIWEHPDFCILADRPAEIHQLEGRLHHADGPSVLFRDGWALWHIRGVAVDEVAVMRPETQDLDDIRHEENVEVQRVRIERLAGKDRPAAEGWARYLDGIGAKTLDERENPVETPRKADGESRFMPPT